ncbi:hypothetical protein EDB86DRAFT_2940129 [Lactarius hatsudake]|nr:hypothetical protein EDB86DRAFT_2940129 [Lactarius hatsudake]
MLAFTFTCMLVTSHTYISSALQKAWESRRMGHAIRKHLPYCHLLFLPLPNPSLALAAVNNCSHAGDPVGFCLTCRRQPTSPQYSVRFIAHDGRRLHPTSVRRLGGVCLGPVSHVLSYG